MVADKNDGRRFFEAPIDGVVKRFYIAPPTADQLRKADWHYSKVYNRAMVEGIATTAEMMGILTKRGLYGDDYKERLMQLQVAVTTNILAAQSETDIDKKREFAQRASAAREELYGWNQRISGPLNNCCEQMADDAKMEYLTSAMVRDENDKPYWATYDEFLAEKNSNLALLARYEVLLTFQGLDKDFLDNMPENKILAEIEAMGDKATVATDPVQPAQLEAGDPGETEGATKKRRSRVKKDALE